MTSRWTLPSTLLVAATLVLAACGDDDTTTTTTADATTTTGDATTTTGDATTTTADATTTTADATTTTGDATTTTAAPTTTTTAIGGGSAECAEAAFLEVLQGAPDATPYISIDSFQCADGWAVVFADVGPSEQEAVTVTEVFEAEGPFWVLQDRGQVCPEPSPVPAAIYQQACETD